jgi:putative hydrolase of the HAD superfamily
VISCESLQNVRWVVFDAVGTVIFADPPVHMAYHRIGRKHGSSITPEDASRRFRQAFADRAATISASGDFATNEDRERQFWRDVVSTVLPDVPSPDACFDELYTHFARPASWGCYVDVADAIEVLRSRKIDVAIASNFDSRLHSVIDGLPDLAEVRTRMISTEVGCKKPSRQFFDAVVSRCGVPANEILMIGDDIKDDIEAARSAGLHAIHLDRSQRSGAESISTLEELVSLVAP